MEEFKCNNSCKNECSDRCIPFYDHEHTMMHYNWANRRMLIALVTVCLTFIVTIIVFVTGYTARERNWLDTLANMNKKPTVVASDGQKTD